MARTVRVTSAQVNAAKLKVQRSATSGKSVSRGVEAIANAKRASGSGGSSAGSALTGRSVTAETAARHPGKTVRDR